MFVSFSYLNVGQCFQFMRGRKINEGICMKVGVNKYRNKYGANKVISTKEINKKNLIVVE